MQSFLGKDVYTIPCASVPKGDDPDGRIVHDYSYAVEGGQSINSVLLKNSVQYITFKDRVKAFSSLLVYNGRFEGWV